jgi:DNA-3-methyladenine glycosylase
MKLLPQSWYARPTVQVAQELLGKLLVREVNGVRLTGIIIETEAYIADDPACHAFKGKAARNQALFGPVGHTYVYFTYGMHFCINIVTREPSVIAGGVLIRALKPIEGLEIMGRNRPGHSDANLTSGPGKLTQALDITRADGSIDVTKKGELYIVEGIEVNPADIRATPRIGISTGKDKLWRFTF